jgi:predicted RNase H-like HicB family nuclease
MEIVFETNGKGFLGWIVELPGSYVRGKTMDEAMGKIDDEITEYQKWLNMPLKKQIITKQKTVESKLSIEDADSDIIFEYDIANYENIEEFNNDCNKILISANKVEGIYKECKYKNIVDKTKVRKTFYGDVHSTINKQYEHIINVVHEHYLYNIGINIRIEGDIIENRIKTIEILENKYEEEGNKYYKQPEENWTLRKVMRRIIWHDRIHGKAMERMENKIKMEIEY